MATTGLMSSVARPAAAREPSTDTDVVLSMTLSNRLRTIETNADGRLGVCMLHRAANATVGWRQHERFPHCSSFKLSLAALVLHEAEHGRLDLNLRLRWQASDVLPVSPHTSAHVNDGLTVRELARATLVTSDNTAANVLLKHLGGPVALTAFWRALGDGISRLDRFEPALNTTPEGTELDTTTPDAMAQTLVALIQGDALSAAGRSTLMQWMRETRTGMARIRAGFPSRWTSGDKTGTGIDDHVHTYVDLAFGGPSDQRPIIVAAYFQPRVLRPPMDAISLRVLADVGRLAAELFALKPSDAQPPGANR